jgi:hypothetical protein
MSIFNVRSMLSFTVLTVADALIGKVTRLMSSVIASEGDFVINEVILTFRG